MTCFITAITRNKLEACEFVFLDILFIAFITLYSKATAHHMYRIQISTDQT